MRMGGWEEILEKGLISTITPPGWGGGAGYGSRCPNETMICTPTHNMPAMDRETAFVANGAGIGMGRGVHMGTHTHPAEPHLQPIRGDLSVYARHRKGLSPPYPLSCLSYHAHHVACATSACSHCYECCVLRVLAYGLCMARRRGSGIDSVPFLVYISASVIRRYRVCAWVSSYLDLPQRVTWGVIVERGIEAVESELRGMVERRGLDWDRLERLAMVRTREGGGVAPSVQGKARIEGGGSKRGGGMPIVGGGGMIDG